MRKINEVERKGPGSAPLPILSNFPFHFNSPPLNILPSQFPNTKKENLK